MKNLENGHLKNLENLLATKEGQIFCQYFATAKIISPRPFMLQKRVKYFAAAQNISPQPQIFRCGPSGRKRGSNISPWPEIFSRGHLGLNRGSNILPQPFAPQEAQIFRCGPLRCKRGSNILPRTFRPQKRVKYFATAHRAAKEGLIFTHGHSGHKRGSNI